MRKQERISRAGISRKPGKTDNVSNLEGRKGRSGPSGVKSRSVECGVHCYAIDNTGDGRAMSLV
jgi:hypothetical protein